MSKLEPPIADVNASYEREPQQPGWSPAGQQHRYNPLIQLTLARIREFVREPEALFWVFVFPVLLAFALGIAFRNTAPQKLRIAVEAPASHPEEAITNGPGSGAEDLATRVAAAISNSPGLVGVALPPAEAARQLRTGKVELIVRAVSAPGDG